MTTQLVPGKSLFSPLVLSGALTVGGVTTLAADPTQPLEAATKQYADTKLTQTQGDARYLTPATAAATYLPLAGGTLTGNLLFSTDNLRDIGAVGATRPRTIYVGTSITTPALTVSTTLSIPSASVPAAALASGAAASNVGTLGGSLSGTLPNPTLAANSVGASQITDGTVGTAELAAGAATNAKLASDTARLNLLTNGGLEIWQRGNGPFTASGQFTADRWQSSLAGSDTLSVSKDTANVDVGSDACAACTFVLSGGAGGTLLFHTSRETGIQVKGRQFSFSVRVKTSTANAVRAFLNSNGTGAAQVFSSFHTGGGAYQSLTVTMTAPTDATFVSCGLAFAVSCTAYLDNAMLVVGSVAADYAPLHPAEDLARCLRYYESASPRNSTYGTAAQQLEWWTPFKVVKAITPTMTLPAQGSNTNIGTLNTAFTNGTGTDIYGAATATGNVLMNPTYVAEANP